MSVNKLGDTAEAFTHEFTCQNFVQSETRLVLQGDQFKSVTKLKAIFFKGLYRKANNLEIQNLYWKNSIGCLSVNWLTFRQDKRKLDVLDSPFPPL